MKNSILIIVIISFIGALSFTSCKKCKTQKDDIVILIPYTDTGAIPALVNVILPGLPAGTYVTFPPYTFPTFTDQFLGNYGVTRDRIKKIVAKSLIVSVEYPTSGQYIDFVDTVKVFLDSLNGTAPDSALFAYKYNFPANLTSLPLDLSTADIKDFFRGDSIRMYLGGTKRNGVNSITPGTILRFNAEFELTASAE